MLLDAGGVDAPLPSQLLQLVTTISPNETELQRLTGLPTASESEMLAAAAALQHKAQQEGRQQEQRGGLQVLLKLGAAGSLSIPGQVADGEHGVVRQAALPVQQVVDTTGMLGWEDPQGWVELIGSTVIRSWRDGGADFNASRIFA